MFKRTVILLLLFYSKLTNAQLIENFDGCDRAPLEADCWLFNACNVTLISHVAATCTFPQVSGTTVTITGTKPAGTNDLEPRFSPTGAKIILTNTNNDDSSPRSIYTIDANGSNRVLLINGAEMPYWR